MTIEIYTKDGKAVEIWNIKEEDDEVISFEACYTATGWPITDDDYFYIRSKL